MVYSNKFVMCVLVDGQPQQELSNGVVKLPFGQEYALRFRNKNSRRAVVKIYIDGENVSGGGYIIPANDHIDIRRHHDKDRAFKFVELDSPEAVDAGKNGPNPDKLKGTIEARFYLEKEKPSYNWYYPYYKEEHHHHHHHHDHYPKPYWPGPIWLSDSGDKTYRTTCDAGQNAQYSSGEIKVTDSGDNWPHLSNPAPVPPTMNFGATTKGACAGGQSANSTRKMMRSRATTDETKTCSLAGMGSAPAPELKDGCTVEGGTTGQYFSTQWIDLEDNYTTLKVFLQGFEDDDVQTADAPKKPRRTNKDSRIDDLEAENERLRQELAELENAKLKEELEKTKKSKAKPKRTRKKKAE